MDLAQACPGLAHMHQLCHLTSEPQGHIQKMGLMKVPSPPGAVVGAGMGAS